MTMSASVFDFEAIRARLDQLGGAVRMPARVLVVDDCPLTVELLTGFLEHEGYVVSKAYDGLQALAKIESEKPDLVLLDVRMPPGIDGFEVCRRIRADPATAHLPVVMMTGLSGVTSRVKGFEADADDFITKPFRFTPLMARVRARLDRGAFCRF
jgi:two-component system cell cycle response regulator